MTSCKKIFDGKKSFNEYGFKPGGNSAEIGKKNQGYGHNASIAPVIGWAALKIL
jgi:hypothetical protein